MQYALKHLDPVTARTGCLVAGIHEDGSLPPGSQALDTATGGLLARLHRQGDLKGTLKGSLLLHHPAGIRAERLLVVGLGSAKKPLSTFDAGRVLATATGVLKGLPAAEVTWLLDGLAVDGVDAGWVVREAVKAMAAATYRFEQYKGKAATARAGRKTPQPGSLVLALAGRQPLPAEKQALADATGIVAGMALARDLGNLPPNVCHPEYLAARAQELGRGKGKAALKVTVLEEPAIRRLGMGAFLAVAQGSERPGRIIAMEYRGGKAKDKPYVLVGKGITFDTGGISLKPGANMDEMKYDMCGAASVFGVMQALLVLKPAINVVGIVAAAENMPSGRASRPGDIVTTLSGQTVEILNTDAEGRLVLCDALTWAAKFEPKVVIDIATLTGACVVALGSQAHGLYSNDEALGTALLDAGQAANDRGWRMPLWDEYQEQLDSPFADMANIGGPKAGSVTAACFLARFTKDYRWAHLDIAGTAWVANGMNKGGTGRPVPLLLQYLLAESRGAA